MNDDDELCCICLQTCTENLITEFRPCLHFIHADCFVQYGKHKCPLCRSDIESTTEYVLHEWPNLDLEQTQFLGDHYNLFALEVHSSYWTLSDYVLPPFYLSLLTVTQHRQHELCVGRAFHNEEITKRNVTIHVYDYFKRGRIKSFGFKVDRKTTILEIKQLIEFWGDFAKFRQVLHFNNSQLTDLQNLGQLSLQKDITLACILDDPLQALDLHMRFT